jgi:DNA-binding response OmpR family regulator
MELRKDDTIINLTATEFKLLELLVKNKGQVLTRNTLLQKLWDNDGNFVDENTLSVNVRRLRKKIESDSKNPQYIITVFSIGYTWGKS